VDEIRRESIETLATANDYFAALDGLVPRVRDRHFDDDDPADREAAAEVLRMLRLRPQMAKAKARAICNLLRFGESADVRPTRTVVVAGRTLQMLNGGLDRHLAYLRELDDVALRGDVDDPEFVGILEASRRLARRRHERHPMLRLLPPGSDLPRGPFRSA
jgi:hypothetical protein